MNTSSVVPPQMREAGKIAALCRQLLVESIHVGVTGQALDQTAEKFIRQAGAWPAFKNYNGYPASICVSRNEVVIHGIPDNTPFREGDIVSLDLGVEKNGFYADCAVTVPVGKVSPEKESLLKTTEQALWAAIKAVRPGVTIDEIAGIIEKIAYEAGFSVVRSFCGHGIGRALHQEPEVPNFISGNQFRLYPGLGIAIEPMVNYRGERVKILSDRWTVVTADGFPSAHFEETVVVSETGGEVITTV